MNTNHHVKMIEYTEKYDFWAEQDNVALVDDRDISEEEVNRLIREGDEYHPRVVFMTKKQYNNVFRSLKGE